MLFQAGKILMTPGALELAEKGVNLLAYLRRHLSGDWGDLCNEDIQENEFSVKNGFRILSASVEDFFRPSVKLCRSSRLGNLSSGGRKAHCLCASYRFVGILTS